MQDLTTKRWTVPFCSLLYTKQSAERKANQRSLAKHALPSSPLRSWEGAQCFYPPWSSQPVPLCTTPQTHLASPNRGKPCSNPHQGQTARVRAAVEESSSALSFFTSLTTHSSREAPQGVTHGYSFQAAEAGWGIMLYKVSCRSETHLQVLTTGLKQQEVSHKKLNQKNIQYLCQRNLALAVAAVVPMKAATTSLRLVLGWCVVPW